MSVKANNDTPLKKTISKAEINALPLSRWDGQIKLINKAEDVAAAVEVLKRSAVLGFDTETRPTFRKGENHLPALLQLATEDEVYLFQLLQIKSLDGLIGLLSDPDIVKAGVAVRDDIKKLQEMQMFESGGFCEVSELTQAAGVVNTGLRSLAGLLLGIRISKSAQISNWAKQELSQSQIHYAATDAWVSRRLYESIDELGLVD